MDEKSFLRYLILRLFIRFQQNIQKFTFLRLNIFKRNEQLLIVAYLVNVFDNWDTSLQVYGIFQTQFDAESFIPESWICLQVKYKMELTFVVTEIGSKNALIHLFPLMFSQNNGVQKMFEWKLQKKIYCKQRKICVINVKRYRKWQQVFIATITTTTTTPTTVSNSGNWQRYDKKHTHWNRLIRRAAVQTLVVVVVVVRL